MRNYFWSKLLLYVGIFLPSLSFSQVLQEWVQRYNSPGNGFDRPHGMAVDRFGNVYVTGTINYSNNQPSTPEDYVTIKYNSTGIQQWLATYNGPGNDIDRGTAITTDNSGNVFVTGISTSDSTSGAFATIKYNSAGVQQWVVRSDGGLNFSEFGLAIAVDGGGNVYVTGCSRAPRSNFTDFATIKYNSSGIQQWFQRYYSPLTGDQPCGIALDLAGNVYVSGSSVGGVLPTKGMTIKYNPSGILLWMRRSIGEVKAMTLDALGNVYITGFRNVPTNFTRDCSTTKYNTNGVEQWVMNYNGSANAIDQGEGIVVDLLGNVYVTGSTDVTAPGGAYNVDYLTIKYNGAGIQQWVSTYNGTGNYWDGANKIAIDMQGNLYVTGRSTSGRPYTTDYATVKYNSSGGFVWVATYNSPNNSLDNATQIALNYPGRLITPDLLAIRPDIYITGFSDLDIVTIKYSQPILISFQLENQAAASSSKIVPGDQKTELIGSHKLSNFPNPFSTSTKIIYELPVDSRVSIKVFDLFGREVAILVHEEKKRGSYSIDYNASGLKNGVYYCTIIAESLQGRFILTKKMIVVQN